MSRFLDFITDPIVWAGALVALIALPLVALVVRLAIAFAWMALTAPCDAIFYDWVCKP